MGVRFFGILAESKLFHGNDANGSTASNNISMIFHRTQQLLSFGNLYLTFTMTLPYLTLLPYHEVRTMYCTLVKFGLKSVLKLTKNDVVLNEGMASLLFFYWFLIERLIRQQSLAPLNVLAERS